MKVQIVDPSKLFCDSVKALLPDTLTVDTCTDCERAASRICCFQPDILVISAALPGNDGLYILQLINSVGVRPKVILITPLVTEYIIERGDELNIVDILCTPCKLQALADHILKLRETKKETKKTTEDWIRVLLLNLGFHTKLCGYRYLLTALELLQKDPNQPLTKVLYPAVAKLHNGSWQQIEHGIRLSIQNAWENRTGDEWEVYFPVLREKPSNAAFLSRAVAFLSEVEN
ncbi:MAG: response regulator [Ruminococcaceae bacterium]|nr:response regulator [Oscillospiraceae bacterium]